MRRMGLKMDMVKAIFISHEHTDHIYGAEVLSGRYELPVYITPATLKGSRSKPPAHLIRHFAAHEPVSIGAIKITGFPKLHDAADPHSFVIETGGVCTGVFTDIGAPCEHVIRYFSRCHAVFLEANYDETMLENGRYAAHLKHRIRSDKGHLSNDQALGLFATHKPAFMSHVFLSHLSKDNNKPEIAQQLFSAHAGKTNIAVAPRHIETSVYRLGTPALKPTAPIRYVQASLF